MMMDLVASGKSTIGIGGAVLKQDDSLVIERIGHAFMMPVASPSHPLAHIEGRSHSAMCGRRCNWSSPTLRASPGPEVSTCYPARPGMSAISPPTSSDSWWRSARGGLPASLILEDLQKGRLVHLDLDAYEQARISGLCHAQALQSSARLPLG